MIAQEANFFSNKDTLYSLAYLYENELLPYVDLEEIIIQPKNIPAKARKKLLYNARLIIAVKKAYPYAKIASFVFNDIKQKEKLIQDKKELKEYVDSRENAMKQQFANKLMKLTVFQGKVLMKLFYRESHITCHQLLKDYKGDFSAGFWQTIAKIFGSSLKQTYDPVNDPEDRFIEDIVTEMEED